jgi:hypothetical protein
MTDHESSAAYNASPESQPAWAEPMPGARGYWNGRTVLERRAVFVYEGARLQAAAVDAPIVPEPWEARDEAFRVQFLDIIERYCTADRLPTPEEAHDSWWRSYRRWAGPTAPSATPSVRRTRTWCRSAT